MSLVAGALRLACPEENYLLTVQAATTQRHRNTEKKKTVEYLPTRARVGEQEL